MVKVTVEDGRNETTTFECESIVLHGSKPKGKDCDCVSVLVGHGDRMAALLSSAVSIGRLIQDSYDDEMMQIMVANIYAGELIRSIGRTTVVSKKEKIEYEN